MTITDAANTIIKNGKNDGTKVGYLNRMQLDWYGDKEYRSGLRNPWNVAAHIIRDAISCAQTYNRIGENMSQKDELAAAKEWISWQKANTQEEDW